MSVVFSDSDCGVDGDGVSDSPERFSGDCAGVCGFFDAGVFPGAGLCRTGMGQCEESSALCDHCLWGDDGMVL